MLSALPPSRCTLAREAISARLDGELTVFEHAWLDQHLRDCPACSADAEALADLTARLRTAPLEQPTIEIDLRRQRSVRAWGRTASVAVAIIVAGTAVSFEAGRILSPRAQPLVIGPAATADAASLRTDMRHQHLLAMLSRKVSGPPDSGREIAI